MERIQKILAAAGIASRRQAEELIKQGRVTLNGQVASLGMLATAEDRLAVDGKPVLGQELLTYVLNKPTGVVCSRKKQAKEKLVTELVPAHPTVYPVGRLDKESGGLLLLTNDGALAQQLSHPSFEHSKQYRVIASWKDPLQKKTTAQVEQALLNGVKLSDGKAKADKVQVTELPDDRLLLIITVHEGRHHLIRRMCAVANLKVHSLIRTHLGSLTLSNLQPGHYRVLNKKELASLL